MSRAKFVIDVRNLAGVSNTRQKLGAIKAHYKNTDSMLQEVVRKMESDHVEPMMNELRREKPKRRKYPDDYPIDFTSDKQRGYVMAKLGGKPYKRRNRIPKGFSYTLRVESGRIQFKLDNKARGHQFVIGKWGLGRSTSQTRRYTKMIQRFHTKTGWKPAYKTVQRYMIPAKEEAIATIREWLANGFTSAGK